MTGKNKPYGLDVIEEHNFNNDLPYSLIIKEQCLDSSKLHCQDECFGLGVEEIEW